MKNIRNGIITTTIGSLFLLTDLAYLLLSVIKEKHLDSGVLIVVATIGVGLLLAPDDLYKKLKEKL